MLCKRCLNALVTKSSFARKSPRISHIIVESVVILPWIIFLFNSESDTDINVWIHSVSACFAQLWLTGFQSPCILLLLIVVAANGPTGIIKLSSNPLCQWTQLATLTVYIKNFPSSLLIKPPPFLSLYEIFLSSMSLSHLLLSIFISSLLEECVRTLLLIKKDILPSSQQDANLKTSALTMIVTHPEPKSTCSLTCTNRNTPPLHIHTKLGMTACNSLSRPGQCPQLQHDFIHTCCGLLRHRLLPL